jgi:hypothetical protein
MGEQDFAAAVLDTLISFGKAQFGDAVKAYWVYAGDLCPCCMKRKIEKNLVSACLQHLASLDA